MATQFIDPVNGSDAALVTRTTTIKTGISAITKANPCQITLNSHGFSNGDWVHLAGIGGMSQINNITFKITVVDVNNFTLDGINSTAFTTYTSGGQATPACSMSNPMVVTSIGHGFGAGQIVTPTNLAGLGGSLWSLLNGIHFKVKTVLTANTFELMDLNGNNVNSTGYVNWSTNAGTWVQWRKIAIQDITKANPAVVTAAGHGYSNGNIVVLEVDGMTEVNNKSYTVANATTNTFELSAIDSTGYGTFTSGTTTRPFLNVNTLMTYYSGTLEGRFYAGDEVKIGRTFDKTAIAVGSGNITFTRGSQTVTTSVSLVGTIVVGNYIGLTTATVEGWDRVTYPDRPPVYYRVTAITAANMTLDCRYGGTTTTVSSINRLRLGTEIPTSGIAGAVPIMSATSGCLWEGGYDFTHNSLVARTTGETALQPTTPPGDVTLWHVNGQGETIRYIGSFRAARGIRLSGVGSNNTVEYCFVNSMGSYCYDGYNATSKWRYCTGTSGFNPNVFYALTNGLIIDNCYGINMDIAFNFTSTTSSITNCKAEVSPGGFNISHSVNCENCICENATTWGFYIGNNARLKGCSAIGCPTGILTVGNNTGQQIQDCIISGSTLRGINLETTWGPIISGCSFSGNAVDILSNYITSNVRIWNCSSNAPTSWFVQRGSTLGGTFEIRDCTIDAPSINKAFQILTGDIFWGPQYTLENSFGLPDGAYFARSSYVKDTTTYRTSGASMKLQATSTLTAVHIPMKVVSFYVAGGTGKTITYYLKRDSGVWAGTITPQLRLGGRIIKTESNITSLTSSWVQYTASATGAEINADGELALEFIYNANNVAIWVDDVTVS